MKFLFRHLLLPVVLNALALFVVHFLLRDHGFEITRGVFGLLIVGAVLGVLNALIRPFLKIISLPLTFFTLGLSFVLINFAILYLLQYFFNEVFRETFGIQITLGDGLLSILAASLLLSAVNAVLHFLFLRK